MKRYCVNCMREITTGTLCADCVNKRIPEILPHQLKPGSGTGHKGCHQRILSNGAYQPE